MNSLNLQKLYYYVICLIAAFILIWGAIDTLSASVSFMAYMSPGGDQSSINSPASAVEGSSAFATSEKETLFDDYYRKRIAGERLTDSLSRLIISGFIFGYARMKVKKLEEQA